jgi:hypothetical protein
LQVEETFTDAGPAREYFLHLLLGLDLDVDACHEVSLFGDGTYFSTNEKIDLEADHASSAVLRGVATPACYQCLSAGQNSRWDRWEDRLIEN